MHCAAQFPSLVTGREDGRENAEFRERPNQRCWLTQIMVIKIVAVILVEYGLSPSAEV